MNGHHMNKNDRTALLLNISKLNYVLMMLGTMIGLSALIALVLAYVYKDETRGWLQTHYSYLIRTFWIGLLYGIISSLTYLVGIGLILFPLTIVWVIVRCIKGLSWLGRQQAVVNPQTWWFE